MEDTPERRPLSPAKQALRNRVRFAYDLQQLRIQSALRTSKEVKTTELAKRDKEFLAVTSADLEKVEKRAFREINQHLKSFAIWEKWLKDQKGVGPAMGGCIVAFIDIERATTVSKIWRYAGLAVIDGKAEGLKKGERSHFDPWFKAKMVSVLSSCLLRAGSQPWRTYYDNYKNRKVNTIGKCMLCDGTGKFKPKPKKGADGKEKPEPEDKHVRKDGGCYNCEGTGRGPWGRGPAHRDAAAKRYMVKMFLAELYVQWRTVEGLPVRAPYKEEYLGKVHSG